MSDDRQNMLTILGIQRGDRDAIHLSESLMWRESAAILPGSSLATEIRDAVESDFEPIGGRVYYAGRIYHPQACLTLLF